MFQKGRVIMVRHVILWKLKDSLSENEKIRIAKEIKENLEGLVGKVPGLISLEIGTNPLPSSNADVMLDSVLENEEALKAVDHKVDTITFQHLDLDKIKNALN